MARLEFFVVSEGMSVDQFTNRLSLFNILEEVASPIFPFVLPSAVVVSLWMMEAGDDERDFQCMLRVTMPNVAQREFPANFKTSSRRHRVIQSIQGFPLNEIGVLRFEVLLNGQHAASHEVDIKRMTVETEDSPPTAEAG
jgi:hypothetical protein